MLKEVYSVDGFPTAQTKKNSNFRGCFSNKFYKNVILLQIAKILNY